MSNACFPIAPARTPDDLQAAARLFSAYAASLDVDLAYQDFAAELAGLPGKYAAPAGELFLDFNNGDNGLYLSNRSWTVTE
ncbi:hypothetical protein [Labrys monachus]|uniref:Uncharacterized protein n=1 Tax=Labrys monachus TaxID=217067 RepID=A0ABU0FLA9_9HYPH|nr:hypothetical protein [Labrys monachus]MDQ0394830.1 hypothetical protein [Labrys monachus]